MSVSVRKGEGWSVSFSYGFGFTMCFLILAPQLQPSALASIVSEEVSIDAPEFRASKFSTSSWNSSSSFSSFICQRDDSDQDRRCDLRNVCWDRRVSRFVYFRDPHIAPALAAASGAGSFVATLNGKPREIRVRRFLLNDKFINTLPIEERPGPIPLKHANFSDHRVHIFFESFWAKNFGHAIVDDMSPLYALMYAFGLITRDALFLTPHGIADNLPAQDRSMGIRFLTEMSNLLSDVGIKSMDRDPLFSPVASTSDGLYLTCVRHLLAGTANIENLGYSTNWVGSWSGFINALLYGWRLALPAAAVNLNDPFPPPVRQHLVIFIKKHGRRRVVNLEELADLTKTTFGVEVLVLNPATKSLHDQISLAQMATVTFSPCGGISFFNVLLRAGATAIIVDYWDPKYNVSSSLEYYFWRHIVRQNTVRYPVKENEITIEPPGDAVVRGEMDYKDYGLITVNLPRAMRIIGDALYRSRIVFDFQ